MAKSLRVCPTFKLYWVEFRKVQTIKRYDHNKPFVTPEDLFKVMKEVYPKFDFTEHIVKYRDAEDLIDLSLSDVLSFQFNENFTQVSFYIFPTKQDAEYFVPPWMLMAQRVDANSADDSSNQMRPVDTLAQPNFYTELRESALTSSLAVDSINSAHPSVTCKRCGSSVSSTRYKCLECPDYDLCASCQKRNAHPDHLMILVPVHFLQSQGVLYQSVLAGIVSGAQKCIPHVVE